MSKVLISPDGQRGTVDDAEVSEALANGYVMADSPSPAQNALPIAAGAAALGGAALAARPVGAAAGRVINQLSREPGLVGTLPRAGRALVGKPARAPEMNVGTTAPQPTAAPEKLPNGFTRVSAADLSAHPEALKNFAEGDPIQYRTLEKIKLAPVGTSKARTARPKPKIVEKASPTTVSEPASPLNKRGAAVAKIAPAGSRHEVQYYSESQGKFVPIEDMPIGHLRNAMNKLHAKLTATNHPSPVTRKQFEAIKNEVTYRAQQAGELTVPGPVKARQIAAKAVEGPSQLERQLQASIEAAQAGKLRGIGAAGPPALEAIMYLLGGANTQQDMEEAQRIYNETAHPSAAHRRALEPQGF